MAGSPQEFLRRHGIRPDKRLGQHFLIDGSVAEREIGYADISNQHTVLEIGPGTGVLTRLIAERARRVIAYETSQRLCKALCEVLPDNVELVNQDFLEADVERVDRVVANVPYNISSPLTFKLLDVSFERGVLMFQKEFAERLAAEPGGKDYSRLSVNAYLRARIEMLESVPSSSFYPKPKVDSAVVCITPRPTPFQMGDPALFQKLVDVLFAHRRKKISTTLRKEAPSLGLSSVIVSGMKENIPHGSSRVEELSPEQIEEIARYIGEKI